MTNQSLIQQQSSYQNDQATSKVLQTKINFIKFIKNSLNKGMDFAQKLIKFVKENKQQNEKEQYKGMDQNLKKEQNSAVLKKIIDEKNQKAALSKKLSQPTQSTKIVQQSNLSSNAISSQKEQHRLIPREQKSEQKFTKSKPKLQSKTITLIVPSTNGYINVQSFFERIKQKRERQKQQSKLKISRDEFFKKYEDIQEPKIRNNNSFFQLFKKLENQAVENLVNQQQKNIGQVDKSEGSDLINDTGSQNDIEKQSEENYMDKSDQLEVNDLQSEQNEKIEVFEPYNQLKNQDTQGPQQETIPKVQASSDSQKNQQRQIQKAQIKKTELSDVQASNQNIISSKTQIKQPPRFNPFLVSLNKDKNKVAADDLIEERKKSLFADLFKASYSNNQPSTIQQTSNTLLQQKPAQNNPFSTPNNSNSAQFPKSSAPILFQSKPALPSNPSNQTNPSNFLSSVPSLFSKDLHQSMNQSSNPFNSQKPATFQPKNFSFAHQQTPPILNFGQASKPSQNSNNPFNMFFKTPQPTSNFQNNFGFGLGLGQLNSKDKQIMNTFLKSSNNNKNQNGLFSLNSNSSPQVHSSLFPRQKIHQQSNLAASGSLFFTRDQDQKTQRRGIQRRGYSKDNSFNNGSDRYDRRRSKKQERIRG